MKNSYFLLIIVCSFSSFAMELELSKSQVSPTFEELKKGVVKDLTEFAEETEKCIEKVYEKTLMFVTCLECRRQYKTHYSSAVLPGQKTLS